MNVGQWIQRVTSELDSAGLFYGHGTDNPGDEAAWLVLHTVGAALDGSFQDWDRPVSAGQAAQVLSNLAARVETAQPLAYILGSAWFAGLEFNVDPAVLVPRSPIAELIHEQFQPWVDVSSMEAVLDLCTGSGCIGIAIAVYLPWVRVDAADISPAALQVASSNIARHQVGSRVQLYQSDLFQGLAGKRYDLIVTNPPYVASGSMQNLPGEYQAEPELGLVSGADGLDACLQIMVQSPDHLNESGMLICEVGESEQRLADLLPSVPFVWLEFNSGGSGVFVLSRQELLYSGAAIATVIKERENVT